MQVTLNLHTPSGRIKKNDSIVKTNKVNSSALQVYCPQLLSFGGAKKNQIAIITSECGELVSTGGVGTVAQDFAQGKLFNAQTVVENGKEVVKGDVPILIMPYYNGQVIYKKDPDGPFLPERRDAAKYSKVEVLKKDGKPIFTKEILQPAAKTPDDLKAGEYKELELIASKKMDWAGDTKEIALYKVKGAPKMNAYMVVTEATARMRKPYEGAGGGYSSSLRPLGEPDAYAEFCKAVVELTPELEKEGVNPRHWLLNDAQCAYIPEYINQKNLSGTNYYTDVRLSYVMHNGGLGYQQRQDAKTMALNFISNYDADSLKNSPVWNSLTDAEKERVYREAVKPFLTSDYQATPVMISLRHCDNGSLVTHCSTVSPGYAESITKGNGFADGIKDIILKKMYQQKNFTGITNGLDTENFGPEYLYNAKKLDMFDSKHIMPTKDFPTDKVKLLTKSGLIQAVDAKQVEKEIDTVSSLAKLQEKIKSISKLKPGEMTEEQKKVFDKITALRTEIENDVKSEIEKISGKRPEKVALTDNEVFSRKLAKINSELGMGKTGAVIQETTNASGVKSYYLQPFEKFSVNTPAEEIIKIKQRNLQNLLTRIYLHNNAGLPVEYIAMKDKNSAKISGDISIDILKKMKKGEKVNAFVAWGRADDQKAIDVTIDAFIKFVNTNKKEAENAVLIMGGQIEDSHLKEQIKSKIELAKRSCEGRFVFIEGFAPNKVLSTGGNSPVIPSRWAPCELTDLEPMKYAANPHVTGLEGLADKNFDLHANPNTATGFKTEHHMNTSLSKLDTSRMSPEAKKAYADYLKKRAEIIEKQRNELKSILFDGNVRYTNAEIDYRLRLFIDNSESCGELKKLRQKTTDVFVIDDLVKSMKERMHLTHEQELKLTENAIKLKSSWANNGLLQGIPNADSIKHSARALYSQRHFDNPRVVASSSTEVAYKSVWSIFQNIFKEKIEKAKKDAQPKVEKVKTLMEDSDEFFEELASNIPQKKSFAEKYLNKQTAFAFLGIAALGALGYYLFKSDTPVKPRKKPNGFKRNC